MGLKDAARGMITPMAGRHADDGDNDDDYENFLFQIQILPHLISCHFLLCLRFSVGFSGLFFVANDGSPTSSFAALWKINYSFCLDLVGLLVVCEMKITRFILIEWSW